MDGYVTPPAADKTIFYFISDGEPNAGYEVDAALESQWESFVSNNAELSFGIGIGDAGLASLQPIAYPDNADGSSDFAIVVDSVTDLCTSIEQEFFHSTELQTQILAEQSIAAAQQ
jgi:hypothetical protein